jgi:ATP-binding cassette subfamily F protein uup
MLKPADLLFLDEPTNDLDIPSLEVLEQSLMEFPGALVLVTHDRYLLDRVSKQILALDGQGNADFFADLGQWEDFREEQLSKGKKSSKAAEAPKPAAAPEKSKENLTSKEQKELKEIDAKISAAEASIKAAKAKLEDPSIATNISKLLENQKLVDAEKANLDLLMERWEELEAKKNKV